MTDLTQKQIEDALTDEEFESLDCARKSLAEARIENKRLKKEADEAFSRGRVIGLNEAMGIMKNTKLEPGGSRG